MILIRPDPSGAEQEIRSTFRLPITVMATRDHLAARPKGPQVGNGLVESIPTTTSALRFQVLRRAMTI